MSKTRTEQKILALLRQGNAESALRQSQRALQIAEQTHNQSQVGVALRLLGLCGGAVSEELFADLGLPEPAPADCFAVSLAIFEQSGNQSEQVHTLRDWAEYEHLRGDEFKAEELWQRAQALSLALNQPLEAVQHFRQPSQPYTAGN